ncbi:MAG TPA: hypothetical protein DCG19_13815 [Cryomorphaceae bacterium]|nr:hypothetical protein [Owenweeksia sp.]HAD98481.1 hypothetical protein [Cryomorphaceae bacterium]|tara:strand:- start:195 stop:926 length:732 start_codon:yes stop_codon:yes gene_type:complete
MISERDISEKFSAIWRQNFPLLTPNFIRVFNETQLCKINDKIIETNDDVRYDLVSETAFNLSEQLFLDRITLDEFISEKKNLENLLLSTAKSIWSTGSFDESDLKIINSELEDIKLISANILEFINKLNGTNVEFRPKLKGYGFIPDLEADLSIDDKLYEIKTVKRNFKSSDLKQLFIYLALRQVCKDSNWKYAGLYNPRRGTYGIFNVSSLVFNLTGGSSTNEAFENLLNGLIRDIEIDSKF